MKLQKIILAAALGACSISAFANWQPYVGAGFGINNGNFSTNIDNPDLLTQITNSSVKYDSNSGPYNFSSPSTMVSPKIQVGIANQYGQVYLGFEASLQYNNNQSSSNNITDIGYAANHTTVLAIVNNQTISTLKWNTSLTTQLGYFLTQNFMPYAKIGITAAQGNVIENMTGTPGGTQTNAVGLLASTQAYPWMFGPTVSLGAQYTLTQHLRVFAETNYTYLWGSADPTVNTTATFNSIWPNTTPNAPKQKYTYASWTFELGTNYYF